MSFSASQVTIGGHAVNNVQGDQVNHTQTITAKAIYVSSLKVNSVRPEHDEFEHLKLGDIYLLREIHKRDVLSCGCSWENCGCGARRRARKTVYEVELVGRLSKFTALVYEGKEAQDVWEEELRHFAQVRHKSPDAWQLYGLSYSKIPLLLFHDELVPLGHFYKRSFWWNFVIYWLSEQMECRFWEIWLNARWNLCKGPSGPDFNIVTFDTINNIVVPASAQMLQNDIPFQFFQRFSSIELDQCILDCAHRQSVVTYPEIYHNHLNLGMDYTYFTRAPLRNVSDRLSEPDVTNWLRFDTAYSVSLGAVARWPQDGWALWKLNGEGIVDRLVMGNGLIRFKLDAQFWEMRQPMLSLSTSHSCRCKAWLSQCSRIIDNSEMTAKAEEYFVFHPPSLRLETTEQSRSHKLLRDTSTALCVYLFVYPPPASVAELILWRKGLTQTHFWSFNENGQSEMSKDDLRHWGVPELAPFIRSHRSVNSFSWPSYAYTVIREWQVARGFDPGTADFARSLGYPEFEILGSGKDEDFEIIDTSETKALEDAEWEVMS